MLNSLIVPTMLIIGIMYFLMIRPQQKRLKEHRDMVASIRRGDTVVTSGGIIGKVAKVDEQRASGGDRRRRQDQGRAFHGLRGARARARRRPGSEGKGRLVMNFSHSPIALRLSLTGASRAAMLHFQRWKLILILASSSPDSCSRFPTCFPPSTMARMPTWLPHKQVNLGLDLQGGAHLLYQLDEKEMVEDWLNTIRGDVRETSAQATASAIPTWRRMSTSARCR